jgi:hypothetical protein
VSNADSGRKLRKAPASGAAVVSAMFFEGAVALSVRDAARDHVTRGVAARSGAMGAARGFDAAVVSAGAFAEAQTFAGGALAPSRRVNAVRLVRANVVDIAACREQTQTRERPQPPCQRTMPAPWRLERTPTHEAQLHGRHPAIRIPTSRRTSCPRRRCRKALESHHRGTLRAEGRRMLLSNDHTRWFRFTLQTGSTLPRSSR